MKTIRLALVVLLLAVAGISQTADLGMGAFDNENGPILLAIDAGLVNQAIKSPYVMFVAYMAAKNGNQAVTVAAKDVVMIYKGQEYAMPSLKELRANYGAEIRDIDLYRHLGKEGIAASWVRFYKFPERSNFFPPLVWGAALAADQGFMIGDKGFVTPLYFKNPGFAKGDKLTIKVRDKKNPRLTGECAVALD